MDDTENGEIDVPDLGNYSEYSPRLKEIFDSAAGREETLYCRVKEAALSGGITVNTVYLPANYKVFSIVFYHKDLSEAAISAIIGEDIKIVDPLVEHRNDILKAIESSVFADVYLRDENERVFTMDMQRSYFKTRNRNRNVYYGAKELACQKVDSGRYERLKHVSVTFVFERNTTPGVPALSKLQFADVKTKEIYTDLLTLYEVNLNVEADGDGMPEDLAILRSYLSIRTHAELCSFVEKYDTWFSRRLVTEYMHAILDDKLLMKVEGSEKFMIKLSEEVLLEERMEGREEGLEQGREQGLEQGLEQGREEGREEGREQGLEQGIELMVMFLREGLSLEDALKKAREAKRGQTQG